MKAGHSGRTLSVALAFVVFSFAANSVITRFMVANEPSIWPCQRPFLGYLSGGPTSSAASCWRPTASPSPSATSSSERPPTFLFFAAVVLSMALLGVILEHERLGPKELGGLALAVAGVFLLTYGGVALVTGIGVILMIVTGVSWGAYSVFGRLFTEDFSYTLYSFATLTAVALPALLLTTPGDLLDVPLSFEGWGLALYFGMISTALSYVLWHWALNRITASQGGVYQMVIPIIAAAMGIAFLSEALSLSLVAGGGLILLGIYLNRRTEGSG